MVSKIKVHRTETKTYLNGSMDIKHSPIIDKSYQLVLTRIGDIYIWNLDTDTYTLYKTGNLNDVDFDIAIKKFS